MKTRLPIVRLAFGSCSWEHRPQPIWKTIRKKAPDLMVMLGDNIYADTTDIEVMAGKYQKQQRVAAFRTFCKNIPLLGIYDDHDYAYDDAGAEVPLAFKRASKRLLLEFFKEPKASARWHRDGAFTSYMFGAAPYRLQLILPDLRWWRGKLEMDDSGAYLPAGPRIKYLGERQWRWLERELGKPADVRILGSSTQLVSSEHRYEKWANFPHEKARFFRMIDEHKVKNLVVISGDMHFGELSMEKTPDGIPIYDLTSSGLNRYEAIAKDIPNSKRIAAYDKSEHFGLVTMDWKHKHPRVKLEVCDKDGKSVIEHKVTLSR